MLLVAAAVSLLLRAIRHLAGPTILDFVGFFVDIVPALPFWALGVDCCVIRGGGDFPVLTLTGLVLVYIVPGVVLLAWERFSKWQ
jgi:hypothetical protein